MRIRAAMVSVGMTSWLLAVCAGGAEIVCEGVLGNSGGTGAFLLRFGQTTARGLGLAIDRWGCLWDRGGRGTLVRFTPDGRMLGSFTISPEEHHYSDRIAIANDRVVVLIREKLYSLPCDAPAGSTATSLECAATVLAPTPWQGRVLIGDARGLTWLDPVTGAKTPAGPGFKDLTDLEVGPEGTIYAMSYGNVHVVRGGSEVIEGSPRSFQGEKPQLIAGAWYLHGWASTIKRYDHNFAPAPGVVLGGNSGSFLGHVDESPDIVNGRGLLQLPGNQWAVGCFGGGACLMSWNEAKRQFTVQRRIIAMPRVTALGIDPMGRVMVNNGYWQWNDTPDAPLRESLGMADGYHFQLAPLGGGRFAAPGIQYGTHPRLRVGGPLEWRLVAWQEQGITVPPDTVGAAAVPAKDGYELVSVTRTGAVYGFTLTPDGRYQGKANPIITTREPKPVEWTSLAVDPEGRLLGAADGAVFVFERVGGVWSEVRRWSSWGDATDQRFGKAVWIQTDGINLWVSDRDRHRVLCFDMVKGTPVASFGPLDQRGDDLSHMDSPQMLAPLGNRCVVHDAGNQRLLKLRASFP